MTVPAHVAIILDGNGRWAKARGMPRSYGHIKGSANLESIVEDAKSIGIKYLTVYAFSTENWKRSRDEVEGLMKIFRSTNFYDMGSLRYLYKYIEKSGVINQLKEMGLEEGDTIRIDDFEFEYVDEF